MYYLCLKHHKNCKCCPVSLIILRSQRLSWIQVLNCQNCNQCLKGHKSQGSLSLSKLSKIVGSFLTVLTILTLLDHFDNDNDNPLRHWLQFWQLKTWLHGNLCDLTIKSDTGQHLQFLRCLELYFPNCIFPNCIFPNCIFPNCICEFIFIAYLPNPLINYFYVEVGLIDYYVKYFRVKFWFFVQFH